MSKQLVQTVYTIINGEPEICVTEYQSGEYINSIKEQEGIFFTVEEYNKHIKEVIEETLKNGAEEVKHLDRPILWGIDADDLIDKDSILNTFEQSYKKFKI